MSSWLGGIESFVAATQKAKARKNRGALRGMGLATRNTLRVSNRQVPHEEGDLERDGAASVEQSPRIRGAVSYGHDRLNGIKAVVNHEDLTLKHDSGRNAKYLENAFNSTRAANAEIIANATKEDMGT